MAKQDNFTSNEMLFILNSIFSEHSQETNPTINEQKISWLQLYKLAEHHRILPLIFSKVRQQIVAESVEQSIQTTWSKNFNYLQKNSMLMTHQLVNLLKIFKQKNLPIVVLKGPPLSQEIYQDPVKRSSRDLDLLVKPQDLKKAMDLLTDQGYKIKSSQFNMNEKQLALLQKWRHDFEYYHPRYNIRVELHWKLFDSLTAYPLNFEKIFTARYSISLAGFPVQVLPPEENFLYLCYHGGNHGWHRLQWLCDVACFIDRSDLDWQVIVDQAKKRQIERFIFPGVLLAADIFQKELPQAIQEQCNLPVIIQLKEKAAKILAMSYSDKHKVFTKHYLLKKRYSWQLRSSLKAKWKYILYHIYAPEEILQSPLPDWLYPLLPILKPFLWVSRRFRLWKKA